MRGAVEIVRRELVELRRSPLLVASMLSLPATVVAVPILVLAWVQKSAPPQALGFVQEMYGLEKAATPFAALVAAIARNWLPMFLVLPIFLPILLAAQSIGGERERHTLEPLLATPVSALEIILGKSVAALVPAIGITWAAAAAFCIGVDLVAHEQLGFAPLPDGAWIFATLVLSPLLALFGNGLAVVVSARVADPRAAQNVAATTVLPLLALLVVQLAGKISLGPRFYAALAGFAALADAILVAASVRLFDRERLLLRWR